MLQTNQGNILSAEVVVPCRNFAETLEFFTEQLGFRLEMILPADAPAVAVISGYGVTLRLEQAAEISLRLSCQNADEQRQLIAPNELPVEFVEAETNLQLPTATQEFVLSRMSDENSWHVGRAGMQYRDLIPGRLGGRFIASHIRIPEGGAVPDFVHYHKVLFQMIYCKSGWVRVVYEDQGEPFILNAGDCVLQPPEIRHRVLEASAGLEVIEIGCPAIHETWIDHNLALPTPQFLPERLFNGQKFVRHIAKDAVWKTQNDNFEYRDTGIRTATNGLADVRVLKTHTAATFSHQNSGEFLFYFVLKDSSEIYSPKFGRHLLKAGDSCVVPSNVEYTLESSKGLQMLEVFLPTFKLGV
jgi:quercetin dioxygenase-like cupin family protein